MKSNGKVVDNLIKDYQAKKFTFDHTVTDPYRRGYADGFMRGMKQVLAPLLMSESSYDRAFARVVLDGIYRIDES